MTEVAKTPKLLVRKSRRPGALLPWKVLMQGNGIMYDCDTWEEAMLFAWTTRNNAIAAVVAELFPKE